MLLQLHHDKTIFILFIWNSIKPLLLCLLDSALYIDNSIWLLIDASFSYLPESLDAFVENLFIWLHCIFLDSFNIPPVQVSLVGLKIVKTAAFMWFVWANLLYMASVFPVLEWVFAHQHLNTWSHIFCSVRVWFSNQAVFRTSSILAD